MKPRVHCVSVAVIFNTFDCFLRCGPSLKNLQCGITLIRRLTVLGIETSCDDTGVAVVTQDGYVLGEALNSQALLHLRNGGIIPPIARDLHAENISLVAEEALKQSGLSLEDIDAVAATVKPGLALSLLVGTRYGQKLSVEYDRPFIPIHHMEAHALSARMLQQVPFPFLVLLISGGHCLVAVAQDVDKFILLGKSLDDAPGEAFDKVGYAYETMVARRLKLTNIAEFRDVGGGAAIEKLASKGDPNRFRFGPILAQYQDCNFSFSGLKNAARKHIIRQEEDYGVEPDQVIPNVEDLCASFQATLTRHLCHRVQRAMEYSEHNNLLPTVHPYLVVAGGVACNKYIQQAMKKVCDAKEYNLAIPPPKLCTDNGLMIAWNGMERLQVGRGIVPAYSAHLVEVEPKCAFGEDHSDLVRDAAIRCNWIKLALT